MPFPAGICDCAGHTHECKRHSPRGLPSASSLVVNSRAAPQRSSRRASRQEREPSTWAKALLSPEGRREGGRRRDAAAGLGLILPHFQITSAADSEAITFQKLVKGHAYSVTGAEEVTPGRHSRGSFSCSHDGRSHFCCLLRVGPVFPSRHCSSGPRGWAGPPQPLPATFCPLLATDRSRPSVPLSSRIVSLFWTR